jgi:integrase
MNTAADDLLIGRNPCRIKDASKSVSPKRPYLTYDESMRIVGFLPPHLHAAAIVAWWSSVRVGELIALRWQDVNLSTGLVHVHRQVVHVRGELIETVPKVHSDRTINITGPGLEVLRLHEAEIGRALPSARVFTNRAGGPLTSHAVGQAWRRARDKADLKNAHFHDMRASSATALLQSGASIYEVMIVLGHKTMEAARTFQHDDPARKPIIAAGLAAHIAKITSVDEPTVNAG